MVGSRLRNNWSRPQIKGARVVLIILISAPLLRCAQGSFGKFMDNPITSWLPIDEYLVGENSNAKVPPMRHGQDKQCYETAKERTELSAPQGNMTASEVQNLFRLEYAECLHTRSS